MTVSAITKMHVKSMLGHIHNWDNWDSCSFYWGGLYYIYTGTQGQEHETFKPWASKGRDERNITKCYDLQCIGLLMQYKVNTWLHLRKYVITDIVATTTLEVCILGGSTS